MNAKDKIMRRQQKIPPVFTGKIKLANSQIDVVAKKQGFATSSE
jgi:hypothetical protein